MDSDLLRAFVAVVDAGGFGAAARSLARTQSAVSLQIRRLETRAGARLLDRTRHSVSLTADGAAFLPYARRLLRLEDEAFAALGGEREPAPVRVGLSDGQALAYLPGVLPAFHAAFPAVRIELVCDVSPALVARVGEGRLDVALSVRHAGDGAAAVIAHEPLVWVAADGVRPNAFRGPDAPPLPLALNPEGCVYRAHALAALARAGWGSRIVYTSTSLTGLDTVVATGLALTVQADRAIPDGCRALAPEDGLPELPTVDVQLHLAPGTRSLAAQWLARALYDAVAARPETVMAGLPPALGEPPDPSGP